MVKRKIKMHNPEVHCPAKSKNIWHKTNAKTKVNKRETATLPRSIAGHSVM